ncbi:MAG: phospho-N-acetylmuramoyl-pentapeptide-transferase [Oscillospiraceae bacterium]|nr:phospho-N-acetylmuramoyl-pentapeptide-transferase [Oscillospiraceae bacterium]
MIILPIALAAAVSFVIAALSGFVFIPMLKKLHFGATIYEQGPVWQKDKNGTPIMGGFLFITGTVFASLVTSVVAPSVISCDAFVCSMPRLAAGLCFALLNGCIGFADDYIKAVKKQREGLTPTQKIVMQIIVSAAFLAALYLLGDTSTAIHFPFIGDLDLWIFYYPVMMLVLIYLTNAVNLTDGVDGLCGSCTVVYALCMLVIFTLADMNEYRVFAAALAGGCMGFLIWNIHPAKVFMGDTGSMFLGGAVCAMGFILHEHVIMCFAAIVYILEALSVVIQTTYFKYTKKKYGEGRRIFKMSPIHHHFEMSGFSENKIVVTFSLITLAGGIAAVLLHMFGAVPAA